MANDWPNILQAMISTAIESCHLQKIVNKAKKKKMLEVEQVHNGHSSHGINELLGG